MNELNWKGRKSKTGFENLLSHNLLKGKYFNRISNEEIILQSKQNLIWNSHKTFNLVKPFISNPKPIPCVII